MGIHLLLAEGRVRRAFELTRDERILLGHHVIVGALREFRRHAGTSAELVEVSRAGDVFEVEAERAVRLAGRGLFAVAAAVGGLEAVAALHLLELALGVFRLRERVDRVDREAVRGPADLGHLLLAAGEAIEEEGGDAVIVVGAVGLDVPMVLVEAQADLDLRGRAHLGVAHQGLVVPRVAAVAVVIDFGGARIEDDAVQGHAPGRHHPPGRAAGERLGVGRDFEAILLLRDGVGVAAVREGRDLVVRDAVGLDDALVALDGEGDLVLAGRLGVGLLEGRALGGIGGGQRSGGEEEGEDGFHRSGVEDTRNRLK